MRKRILILAVVALAASLLASQAALAFGVFGESNGKTAGWEGRPREAREPCLDLALTEDQADRIKESRCRFIEDSHSLMLELRLARADLWRLRASSEPDETAIQGKIDQIEELRLGIRELRQSRHNEMMGILSQEQQHLMENRSRGGSGNRKGI